MWTAVAFASWRLFWSRSSQLTVGKTKDLEEQSGIAFNCICYNKKKVQVKQAMAMAAP